MLTTKPSRLSPESRDALASGDKTRLRAIVLAYVRQCRDRGATADETSKALRLVHNSVAPRLTELEERGLIVKLCDSQGERIWRETRQGSPAGVYVAPEFEPDRTETSESLFGELMPDRSYRE